MDDEMAVLRSQPKFAINKTSFLDNLNSQLFKSDLITDGREHTVYK
jgi:hypothetical protein